MSKKNKKDKKKSKQLKLNTAAEVAASSSETIGTNSADPVWTVKTAYGYSTVRAARAQVGKKKNTLKFYDAEENVVGRFLDGAWRAYVIGTEMEETTVSG